MKDIKKSTKDKTIHANSIGKVIARLQNLLLILLQCCCCLMCLFITMHKLHLLHGLTGIYLSKNKNLFQKHQIVLVKFCLHQNEDQAWKLFGKRQFGTVGWTVSNLRGSSVQYFCQLKAGVFSSYKDYQATYKGEKRKELTWIHHFVILQLFHPKFCMEKDIRFEHKNSGLFLCQLSLD